MNIKKYIVVIFAIALALTGCRYERMEQYSTTELLMGTIVQITIYDYQKQANKHLDEMTDVITNYENLLSKNIKTSDISKINEMAGKDWVQVSPITVDIINKGVEYSRLSKGKFDITIGPLVQLWDINGDNPQVPSQEEINRGISLINYEGLKVDKENNTVKLEKTGMNIDLGGIAKGYIADELVKYMENNNIEHGVINLGGNIVTVGSKIDKKEWKIGVQNPLNQESKELGIASIQDKSIVTSGIYQRYFEKNGIKYHHILDPKTGFPYNNELASVTIISKNSVDGDALSTSVFAMGIDEGFEFVESREDIDAIFITLDKKIYLTSGAEKIFKLTDENFEINNK